VRKPSWRRGSRRQERELLGFGLDHTLGSFQHGTGEDTIGDLEMTAQGRERESNVVPVLALRKVVILGPNEGHDGVDGPSDECRSAQSPKQLQV
jgi:hypothetical protein